MTPNTLVEAQIQHVMQNPETSEWVKAALLSALKRDCVDAANDAALVHRLLDERVYAALGLPLESS